MLSEFKDRSTVYKGKGVYKVKIIPRFMTLYQILNKAKFDDVFKDIVSYVPEVVEKKSISCWLLRRCVPSSLAKVSA